MNIIVFSITYFPFVGGAEVALKEITKRLQNYNFTIITLQIDSALPKVEREGNVTIYRIGFPSRKRLQPALNWKLLLSKYTFPFVAFLKARNLQKELGFQASWSIMANYAGFASLFFKLLHPKIPFLLILQEGDSPEHIKRKVGSLMPFYRKIFSKADKIQTISRFLADYAKKMGYKGEPIVIPNGVDVKNFSREFSEAEISDTRKEINKKEGDVFLVTSSRMVKKNAVDVIIKSLVYLPENFKFIITGEGEEEGSLKRLSQELKVESRVSFLGLIPHQKLPLYLKACDVFVRPSRSEGFGNSFIEAMAVGIPVIGTSVGGIPDFLKNEVTGLFCDVDDPQSLAKVAKTLIKNDKLREKIIKNARKLVLEKYSWDILAKRMDNILSKL